MVRFIDHALATIFKDNQKDFAKTLADFTEFTSHYRPDGAAFLALTPNEQIDALGELGILYRESPYLRANGSWQFMYMLYLGLIIGGGTSQIQKNIISERGLGMPKSA